MQKELSRRLAQDVGQPTVQSVKDKLGSTLYSIGSTKLTPAETAVMEKELSRKLTQNIYKSNTKNIPKTIGNQPDLSILDTPADALSARNISVQNACRFGQCEIKASEWAAKNKANVYVSGFPRENTHAIAVKDGMVYDYVFSPKKLIPQKQYFNTIGKGYQYNLKSPEPSSSILKNSVVGASIAGTAINNNNPLLLGS